MVQQHSSSSAHPWTTREQHVTCNAHAYDKRRGERGVRERRLGVWALKLTPATYPCRANHFPHGKMFSSYQRKREIYATRQH